MKIGVLVKQVPDTETRIKLSADAKGIDDSQVKWIINPYDEFAVEEALRLKEKAGGEVVVISAGPSRAVEVIRASLAMGADRGVRIDTAGVLLDSNLTSKLLAMAVSEENLDIVFAGKQAVDDDCSQVVSMVSGILGWPGVPVIETFELAGGKAVVQRPMEGSTKEILEVEFPAIFGCEKGLNKPRYASLPGIMKAKTKPVAERSAKEMLGGDLPRVEVVGFKLPPERQAGRKIEGEPAEVAEKFVRYLREEIKII
jgi:electron transfer flavoprotein beta subunit